jgi:putative thioredoxin
MAADSQWIRDVTVADFEAQVVEKSRKTLVLVDFWAPWCGPCRQLTPLLEKLANEYAGKFVVAKVNVDEQPDLAAAFRVQSIPHVFAILDAQPVDQFQGVVSEESLRRWLDSLIPSPAAQLVHEAEQLETTDPAAAEKKLREALGLEPANDAVKIRLARVLLARNREHESAQIIEQLQQRGYLEPEAERIKSQLDVRLAALEAGGVDAARQAAAANPNDPALQLQLAEALAVARKYEEAFDICLKLVQRDRDGAGVQAKEVMLKIFDMLGPSSELVGQYRRKLATLLY